MRGATDGFRRDYLCALIQRMEVDNHEVRIIGNTSDLIRALASKNTAKSAANGVRAFVPEW